MNECMNRNVMKSEFFVEMYFVRSDQKSENTVRFLVAIFILSSSKEFIVGSAMMSAFDIIIELP